MFWMQYWGPSVCVPTSLWLQWSTHRFASGTFFYLSENNLLHHNSPSICKTEEWTSQVKMLSVVLWEGPGVALPGGPRPKCFNHSLYINSFPSVIMISNLLSLLAAERWKDGLKSLHQNYKSQWKLKENWKRNCLFSFFLLFLIHSVPPAGHS